MAVQTLHEAAYIIRNILNNADWFTGNKPVYTATVIHNLQLCESTVATSLREHPEQTMHTASIGGVMVVGHASPSGNYYNYLVNVGSHSPHYKESN